MGLDPISWIALAGLAVSAAGAGKSAYDAHEAKVDAKDAAKDQEQEQIKIQDDMVNSEKQAADVAAQQQKMTRQRALYALRNTSNPNVQTGPRGLVDAAPTVKKVALGA